MSLKRAYYYDSDDDDDDVLSQDRDTEAAAVAAEAYNQFLNELVYYDDEEDQDDQENQHDNEEKEQGEDQDDQENQHDNEEKKQGEGNVFEGFEEDVEEHNHLKEDGEEGESFTVTATNKNKPSITTDSGRGFCIDKTVKKDDGSTILYLRCDKKFCQASRVLKVGVGQDIKDGILQLQKSAHDVNCHPSTVAQALKQNRKAINAQAEKGIAYKKARTSVINELMAKGKSVEEVAASVPPKQKGASGYSKKQASKLPPLPKTSVGIVIIPELQRKVYENGINEERFLLKTVSLGNKSIVVYASDRMLHCLISSTSWHTDGTFSIPPPFKQLLTIHGKAGDFVIPCVYALAPDKQQDTYLAIIEAVMSILSVMIEGTTKEINVQSLMADFEAGLRKAFATELPKYRRGSTAASEKIKVTISGCHFHLTDDLKKQIQAKGLVEECYVHLESRLFVYLRHLYALPFVKPDDIIPTYMLLKKDTSINPTFHSESSLVKYQAFAKYFEEYWLGVTTSHRNGQVEIARKISVHGLDRRTNNDVEAWHAGMAASFKNCRSIWKFIMAIQSENIEKEILYEKIKSGEITERNQSKTQKDKEKKDC